MVVPVVLGLSENVWLHYVGRVSREPIVEPNDDLYVYIV